MLLAVALAIVIVAGIGGWTVSPAAATGKHRAAAPKHPTKDLTPSFQKFCEQWMEKVWARESAGVLSWQTDGDGVRGSYGEYSRDYTCVLTTGKPPVGKVNYRETRYEKRGKTIAEAQGSTPTPIEIFDTAEYFTYLKGKWQ